MQTTLDKNAILRSVRWNIFDLKYLRSPVRTYRNSSNLFIGRFGLVVTIFFMLIAYEHLPFFAFYDHRGVKCSPDWTPEHCEKVQEFGARLNQVMTSFYAAILVHMIFVLPAFLMRYIAEANQHLFTPKFTQTVSDLLADCPVGVLIEYGSNVSLDTQVPIVHPDYSEVYISLRELVDLASARAVFELLHDPLHINQLLQCLATAMQDHNSYLSKLYPAVVVKIAQYCSSDTYWHDLQAKNKWGFWYWLQENLFNTIDGTNVRFVRSSRNGSPSNAKALITAYLTQRNSIPCLMAQLDALLQAPKALIRKVTPLPMYTTFTNNAQKSGQLMTPYLEHCFDIESQQVYVRPVGSKTNKVA
jgi:hypothetical protein